MCNLLRHNLCVTLKSLLFKVFSSSQTNYRFLKNKMSAFIVFSLDSSDILCSSSFIKIYLVILSMKISLLQGIIPSLTYKFKHISDFNIYA